MSRGAGVVNLVGLSSGVGTPSSTTTLTSLVLEAAAAALAASGREVTTGLIEVRDIARDATDEVLGGLRTAALDDALHAIEGADGLVVATPVFRGSYAGVLKTVLDLLEPGSLRGVPTVLAATSGSVRHTLMTDFAMRPLLSYFGALTMPTSVVATPEDFTLGVPTPELATRIARAATQLTTFAG